MAATEELDQPANGGVDRSSIGASSLIIAALALPGVLLSLPQAAEAEDAPEQGIASVRYLSYRDWQPGLDRIHVTSPSLYVLTPIGPRWSLEGSLVHDSVSGASPRYHTAISGASRMDDNRHGADVKLTRYEPRSAWSVGAALSDEHDYHSRALSLEARLSSDDNNRTVTLALSHSHDRIGSVNDLSLGEHRNTTVLQLGLTQAVSTADLLQVGVSFSHGRGFFSDPYKDLDVRPRKRDGTVIEARWNHHVETLGATLRSGWRYYTDTFGIDAHTLQAEWVQPINAGITLTPSARYYTQSAANFYYDPVYDPSNGAPYPPGYFENTPTYLSPDQRLAAFGAVTVGMKVGWTFSADWLVELQVDRYEQRSQWRAGGGGSPGLAPFSARWVQVGLSKRF